MLFEKKPSVFNPWYHTVSVFILAPDGKVLFLRRGDKKHEGGKFGTPGGKKEKHETPIQTAIREVFEETGIKISESELKHFKKVYVKYPEHDFIFEMFESSLNSIPPVKINQDEHSEYVWVTLDEALTSLPLVRDGDSCLRLFIDRLG